MRIYSSISQCAMGYRNPEWHCAACKRSKQNRSQCSEQLYTYIQPRDTALVLSKEYLQIPNNMCGNVYSRVSTVSSGLGHISTTIDPLWKGALLIAISNPSSEPIKLVIQDERAESVPLATVTLQYLNTSIDSSKSYTTHLPARVDILERYLFDLSKTNKRYDILRTFWHRFWYIKDYNLTVMLIDRLKTMKDIQPREWGKSLAELEKAVCAQKMRGKKWRYELMNGVRLLRKFLLIGAIVILAVALYQATVAESIPNSNFIGPLIIAIVESIVALILGQ